MNIERTGKIEYLTERMLDGARVLYEFFEELKDNRNSSPEDLSKRLKDKYELTIDQGAYLTGVGIRASKARGIIRYLENRFGLDNELRFIDPQGLYALLHRTKKPVKNLEAHSYNIAVGFTKHRWLHKGVIGFVNGSSPVPFDQLDTPLDKTISRLEKGKTTACADLSFSVPSLKYIAKLQEGQKMTPGERLIAAIFGEEIIAEITGEETINHELRHIFDFITGVFPSETAADLYSVGSGTGLRNRRVIRGLKRDAEKYQKRYEASIERLKYFKSEPITPQRIIIQEEKHLNKLRRYAKEANDEASKLAELLRSLPRKDYSIISYIFSMFGNHRLGSGRTAHRLELALPFILGR